MVFCSCYSDPDGEAARAMKLQILSSLGGIMLFDRYNVRKYAGADHPHPEGPDGVDTVLACSHDNPAIAQLAKLDFER